MKKGDFSGKSLLLLLCGGLLALPAVWATAGARQARPVEQMGGGMPQRPQDIRRLEQEQQAQQAAALLEQALDDFFTQVNTYQDPGEIYVKSAAALLDDSRRHMMTFDDPQKARYMLLQGWVEYCSGENELALTSGTRACRMDATYRDGWISQQYFSLLVGKRPLQPRPPRQQTQRMMGGADPSAEAATGQSLYGTAGKLEFDPQSLRGDLIGRELKPFTAAFLDGTPLNYQRDKQILCLLVWEIPEEQLKQKPQAEPSERLLYTQPGPGQSIQPGAMTDDAGTYSPDAASGGAQRQLTALEPLQNQAADSKEIRFFTVITNKPDQKQAAARYLTENSHPLPQLYAFGSSPDLTVDAKTPFVLVVDKQGLFRFAGSAEGFILPMLLARLTGITFIKSTPQGAGAGMDPSMEMPLLPEGMEFHPSRIPLPGDPNRPAPVPMDPNSQTGAALPQRPQAPASKQIVRDMKEQAVDPVSRIPTQDLTPEEVCGSQQLASARDFFIKAAGRKFISYRNGIDLCRQVIKQCPNSENAKVAHQLLRDSIPEDQREKYGLTKEELGL